MSERRKPPLELRHRPRRLRRTEAIRGFVRESRLSPEMLVYPLFAVPGEGQRREVGAMPGVYQLSADEIVREAQAALADGVPGVLLFGLPESKDPVGTSAYDPEGPVQTAVRALKQHVPQMLVITDVCLCEYTDHGHCGVLHEGQLDNDASLENLARTVLSYAKAGVDVVAPSGMLDGFVSACRESLDEEGFDQLPILAYSAKYASAYYGPFRDAVESAPKEGDRRGYQMDPANAAEALREVQMDVAEGADMIMVKPALAYLDIIRLVSDEVNLPLAAYNVSGEYAMIEAAAQQGWIDKERVVMETLTGIRRAGADIILTYHDPYAAELLGRGRGRP
jgi:porphobilinogen synthase